MDTVLINRFNAIQHTITNTKWNGQLNRPLGKWSSIIKYNNAGSVNSHDDFRGLYHAELFTKKTPWLQLNLTCIALFCQLATLQGLHDNCMLRTGWPD